MMEAPALRAPSSGVLIAHTQKTVCACPAGAMVPYADFFNHAPGGTPYTPHIGELQFASMLMAGKFALMILPKLTALLYTPHAARSC